MPCGNNGVCSDGITGNGTCTCAPGFRGTACEDCKANLYGNKCSNVCSCKNGICDSGVKGTGQCTCLSGYTGIDCDRELPACAALRCGPNSRCIEDMSTGQLLCRCKPGYQGDGTQCTSINPCLRGVCHANAVCAHTGPNQHVCTCTEGYSGDGRVCMPIDPCQTNLGNCTSGSTRCVYDGPGKSHCECLEGFEKFVERKGCSVKDVCKPDSCHKYATCATVEPGTVDCKCREGYIGNGKICFGNIIQQLQDLNSKPGGEWTGQLSSGQILVNGESVLELDVEAKNGRLHSLEGILIPPSIEPIIPHRCDIKETNIYKVSHIFKLAIICLDQTPRCCKGFFGPDCSPCPGGFTAPCSSHGTCSEGIDGNGTCQCEPNFKGSRCQYCADSNKYGLFCDKTCGCIHGVCDNRPEASGKCKQGSCKEGYTGEFCEQQTQLCGPNQPCHAHANCVSNKGAFTCVCKPGFQGDGYMCVESDPCALPRRGGCSINAKCIKTGPGKHICQCLSGWREDGDECQAINNCLDPSRGGCHPNATCIYVGPGQSDCACKNGYHGNGRDCEPVNQCVVQKGGCHFLATCRFLNPGGWQCVCEDDYAGDGKICYGTLAQVLYMILGYFSILFVEQTDLSQLISETENYTLFVPSAQATEKLSQEDKDFWMTRSNLPSLIKPATPQIKIIILYIWLGIVFELNFFFFFAFIQKHNLTNEMEESSGFTVFAPTDSAIKEYLSRMGKESMDLNVTQYHIIINESLKDGDLVDGLYKDTMLGFSYQLRIFRQDKKLLVNEAEVNVTDIETSKGVIHTVSAVLSIPSNRCDRATTKIITVQNIYLTILPGHFYFYPVNIKSKYGHYVSLSLQVRKCCAGYYGITCEKCPGPEGQSCFGNGVCVDGINGTGICQCNQGFNGTACETCQAGKYGIHCDQECKCVNGRCKDGVDGDGSCTCNLGWRGINCNVAITSDMCGGKCHSSANCLLNVVDSTYYCSCAAGFKGNGTYCTAVDACAENNGGCSVHAVCKRTLPGRRMCVCHPGYAGDGKVCVCKCKNGGCHRYAQCTMTGPLEKNCTCRPGFIGDGETCKGTLQRVRNTAKCKHRHTNVGNNIPELGKRGPFTVFAPNTDAYNKPEVKNIVKRTRMEIQILKYHIVACRALLPEDLMQPRNLTTLTGDILTITYSEDTIYINNKAKVVFSDLESSNGIFHEIDTVLVPPGFQIQKDREQDSTPRNLSDVVSSHGFKTIYKLLEDTDTLKLVMDPIHQPVTLFLPTDAAMATLPQEQKDFLYAMHNRDQLAEYLRYHIVRDSKLLPSELIHASSLKTQQGSDLSVACMGEEHIGELYVNHKSCRIVKRDLDFNGGMIYGIDCLLNPPSVGGRCDYKHTIDFTVSSSKVFTLITSKKYLRSGCQSTCTVVIWKPKCCSGYYGRDCLACPGGPGSPCSDHGKCDEDHLGNGTCTCDAGFTGVACELCVDGHFGPDCKACNCTEHGSCDEGPKGTGSCFCEEGWTGLRSDGLVCNPACHEKGVCMENNTCVCKPFYEGDGITCTAANMCKYWNGGCSKDAKCSQKGEKVSCTCLKGFSGDGFECTPVDPCADGENGGCHEHAICTMTGAGKRKCECKDNYIGDGIDCEAKQLPVNRCLQDNGQCHSDAQCTDLHYEDKTLGVFHYRSSKGTYKLNYTMAQEACKETEGTIATYTQLSYAQQVHLFCLNVIGCLFSYVCPADVGHILRFVCVSDVKCECKTGYIGDGYSCTGNLLQVLSAKPTLSNFLSVSRASSGKKFVNCLSNITIQSTLFVPDNDGLFSNQTLSGRDIEHHLLDGRALVLQALINITHVRTRLGHSLTITGTSSGYINDRYVMDSDILASNGVIHVLQGPLKAPPPPPPSIHPAHKAGMGIGVLGLIILIVAAGFVGYNFYTHKTKPFQFHYFKVILVYASYVNPSESSPNISNPVYDSFPATKEQAPAVSESKVREAAF
uniref:Stabilin 2 n=1 Tax=Cyprinus carpio TaxID=7962 RepID=A0A8C1K0B5_CYPCA